MLNLTPKATHLNEHTKHGKYAAGRAVARFWHFILHGREYAAGHVVAVSQSFLAAYNTADPVADYWREKRWVKNILVFWSYNH